MLKLFSKIFTKKVQVSEQDIAESLYRIFIKDREKKPLKNTDGVEFVSTDDLNKLLLTQLYVKLSIKKLDTAKLGLMSNFVKDTQNIRDDGDFYIQMNLILNDIKEIQKFFSDLPENSATFYKDRSLLGKTLNPLENTLILSWYVEHLKEIDLILERTLNKVIIK